MKRVLMLATTAAMIEQFNKSNIEILLDMGYEVHVIGNWLEGNPISDERLIEFQEWLLKRNCKWFQMNAKRNPLKLKDNYKAYKLVISLINQYKYEFIHCHTPIGSVIARLAGKKTFTTTIYTAHGFHFYKGAPLKNWVLYYPVEKWLSKYTDTLIVINHGDFSNAKKKFHMKNLYYIPGVGIDWKRFSSCKKSKEIKRKELGIDENAIVLLSVGELSKNKNQETVMHALAGIENEKLVYVVAGKGELYEYYKKLVNKLKISNKVLLLGARDDIDELCVSADIFIHISLREGLGLAPLEGMASGLPLIATEVGGMKDYVEQGKTGICIRNPLDVDEVKTAIERLVGCSNYEAYLEYNQKVAKEYSVEVSSEYMRKIYGQLAMRYR